MFELSLSDEQQAISEVARSIALAELEPAAKEAEQNRSVPTAVRETVFQLGLTLAVREKHGGGGIPDLMSLVLATEGFSYGDPGIAAALVTSGLAPMFIEDAGNADQQLRLLPVVATDASAGIALALYEGFGRAPSEHQTTITAVGDAWHVVGKKVGVLNLSESASLIVVGVDGESGQIRGAILDTETVATVNAPGALALQAGNPASITFDTMIDSTSILGGPGADPRILASSVSKARLLLTSLLIGCAERALEYASEYAVERIAFGKPIAAFQGVSFLMADARIQLEAARLESWSLAARLMQDPTADCERDISHAVAYAGVMGTTVTRDAVQVLGGHGFIEDHPVERWYRSAAMLSSLDFDPTCAPFALAI